MMDFDKLLEPYNAEGKRTVGKQIAWLLKKGLPQTAIDYAMANVYKQIEGGKVFIDGSELDRYLYAVAKGYHSHDLREQLEKRIKDAQTALDADWNKLTKWQKIKQVMKGEA